METSAVKARDKFVKCVVDRGNQQEKPGDSEGEVQRNWERRGKKGEGGGKTETERGKKRPAHIHTD